MAVGGAVRGRATMSALTDAIGEVCRLLSTDPGAAGRGARARGVIEEQTEALQVRPRDEHFDDAYVVHEHDGKVTHVDSPCGSRRRSTSSARRSGPTGRSARVPTARGSSCSTVPGGDLIASAAEDSVSGVTVRRD